MCCDIGNIKKETLKPNKDEIAAMGCNGGTCAECDLYGWHSMLGEWQPLDGWCSGKIRLGNVRADEPKCNYFVQRGDLT